MDEDFDLYKDDIRFNESKLPGIVADANQAVELEDEIDKLEDKLKLTKARHLKLISEDLPDKMKEAGLQEVLLPSGWRIEIKQKVYGTLPKGDNYQGTGDPAKRSLAIDTVRKLGGEEIIKNTMTIVIDRGKDNFARELAAWLQDQYGLNPIMKEDINHMTLQAWCREQLQEVPDVGDFLSEVEKVGLYVMDVATVKRKK